MRMPASVAERPPTHVRFAQRRIACALHDVWRRTRLRGDGTYQPRLKMVNGVEFDIATLSFDQLPQMYQISNLVAARTASRFVEEGYATGRAVNSDAFMEEAAKHQHDGWVDDHLDLLVVAHRGDAELLVPYDGLPEVEREKNRAVVRVALCEFETYVRSVFDAGAASASGMHFQTFAHELCALGSEMRAAGELDEDADILEIAVAKLLEKYEAGSVAGSMASILLQAKRSVAKAWGRDAALDPAEAQAAAEKTAEVSDFVRERIASKLHATWRETRLREDGTYAPRMKELQGLGSVDIASMGFESLPREFQSSNVTAARTVGHFIEAMLAVTNQWEAGVQSDHFLEAAAESQHTHWMKENCAWADPAVLVPYGELAEAEKQKTRSIVRVARDEYVAYLRNAYKRGDAAVHGVDFETFSCELAKLANELRSSGELAKNADILEVDPDLLSRRAHREGGPSKAMVSIFGKLKKIAKKTKKKMKKTTKKLAVRMSDSSPLTSPLTKSLSLGNLLGRRIPGEVRDPKEKSRLLSQITEKALHPSSVTSSDEIEISRGVGGYNDEYCESHSESGSCSRSGFDSDETPEESTSGGFGVQMRPAKPTRRTYASRKPAKPTKPEPAAAALARRGSSLMGQAHEASSSSAEPPMRVEKLSWLAQQRKKTGKNNAVKVEEKKSKSKSKSKKKKQKQKQKKLDAKQRARESAATLAESQHRRATSTADYKPANQSKAAKMMGVGQPTHVRSKSKVERMLGVGAGETGLLESSSAGGISIATSPCTTPPPSPLLSPLGALAGSFLKPKETLSLVVVEERLASQGKFAKMMGAESSAPAKRDVNAVRRASQVDDGGVSAAQRVHLRKRSDEKGSGRAAKGRGPPPKVPMKAEARAKMETLKSASNGGSVVDSQKEKKKQKKKAKAEARARVAAAANAACLAAEAEERERLAAKLDAARRAAAAAEVEAEAAEARRESRGSLLERPSLLGFDDLAEVSEEGSTDTSDESEDGDELGELTPIGGTTPLSSSRSPRQRATGPPPPMPKRSAAQRRRSSVCVVKMERKRSAGAILGGSPRLDLRRGSSSNVLLAAARSEARRSSSFSPRDGSSSPRSGRRGSRGSTGGSPRSRSSRDADATRNGDAVHPLIQLERVKSQRMSFRKSMKLDQSQMMKLGKRASMKDIASHQKKAAEAAIVDKRLSQQISTLQRIASQPLIVDDAHVDYAGSTKPEAGALELIALLKRKVSARGSGDESGRTLCSPESGEAAVRLFAADRNAMDAIVDAVKMRRAMQSSDSLAIASAVKRASVHVLTAALRRILIDCYAPFIPDRISAAMSGVYHQKTAANMSEEAKITALLPLVKRIEPERRVVLARFCVLLKSCSIAREHIDDLIDSWGSTMASLSTKNAKLASAWRGLVTLLALRPELAFYADLNEHASTDHAQFIKEGGFHKLFLNDQKSIMKRSASFGPKVRTLKEEAAAGGRSITCEVSKSGLGLGLRIATLTDDAGEMLGDEDGEGERAVALYDCNATEPGELSFTINDVILVTKKFDDGWCEGTLIRSGVNGLFPLAYVRAERMASTPRAKNRHSKQFEWAEDDHVEVCTKCACTFNIRRRRHHCRSCGEIFCNSCSQFRIDVPKRISNSKKSGKPKKNGRVCEPCFVKYGGVVQTRAEIRASVVEGRQQKKQEKVWAKSSFFAIAVFACEAESKGEISFRTGEKIEVLSKVVEGHDEGWWFGRVVKGGNSGTDAGIFPSNHVEVIDVGDRQKGKRKKKRFGIF